MPLLKIIIQACENTGYASRFSRPLLIIMCMGLLVCSPVQAALTATVDATEVTTEQSLRLVVTSDLTAGSNDSPDFSVLSMDFDILSSSSQTNLQTINQKMTQTRSWHLELTAKRKGRVFIPAFTLDGESSQPIEINVAAPKIRTPGESKGEYYIEAAVDTDSAYVQAQIIYTLRVYAVQNFLEAGLSELKSDGLQFQQLGENRSYQEVIGGRPFRVVEVKYAVFPQRSGEFVIPAVQLSARVPRKGARNQGLFTPSETIRRQSEAVRIKVLPRPASSGTDWWLPASHVQLAAQWEGDVAALRVGDSVTRTVALLADGVSSNQLPALQAPADSGFKVYAGQPQLDDQVAKDGLRAVRQEKWAVVALQPGPLNLPEIRVPWFNTKTGKTDMAILPAETLTVLPAARSDNGAQTDSPSVQNTTALPGNPATQAAEQAAEQARSAALIAAAVADMAETLTRWKWLALATTAAWLLTAAALGSLMWRKFRTASGTTLRSRPPIPPSLAALEKACAAGDARQSAEALLEWAKAYWPHNPPRTLVALGQRLASADLDDALKTLDSALYADDANSERVPSVLSSLVPHLKEAVASVSVKHDAPVRSALPGL